MPSAKPVKTQRLAKSRCFWKTTHPRLSPHPARLRSCCCHHPRPRFPQPVTLTHRSRCSGAFPTAPSSWAGPKEEEEEGAGAGNGGVRAEKGPGRCLGQAAAAPAHPQVLPQGCASLSPGPFGHSGPGGEATRLVPIPMEIGSALGTAAEFPACGHCSRAAGRAVGLPQLCEHTKPPKVIPEPLEGDSKKSPLAQGPACRTRLSPPALPT